MMTIVNNILIDIILIFSRNTLSNKSNINLKININLTYIYFTEDEGIYIFKIIAYFTLSCKSGGGDIFLFGKRVCTIL